MRKLLVTHPGFARGQFFRAHAEGKIRNMRRGEGASPLPAGHRAQQKKQTQAEQRGLAAGYREHGNSGNARLFSLREEDREEQGAGNAPEQG